MMTNRFFKALVLDQGFVSGYGMVMESAWGLSWLHRALYALAWPAYECELCVGQEEWRGCYCAYHGASAPGGGVRLRELMARWVWKRVRKDRN